MTERTNIKHHEKGIITFTREITHLQRSNFIDFGWGNGYIGLPIDHPLSERDYDDLYDLIDANVHGGWTYGSEEEIEGIKYFVFGFDTAHHADNLIRWPEMKVVREIESIVPSFINYVP